MKDQSYRYNGQPQGEGDTTYEALAVILTKVTADGLQGSDFISQIDLDGQGKDPGKYDKGVTASNAVISRKTDDDKIIDVTKQYIIQYVYGILYINPYVTFYGNGGETEDNETETTPYGSWYHVHA